MNLSARLSQQQTFSPQMQQGLELLQAPIMQLRGLVAAELVANPVLEEVLSSSQHLENLEPEENVTSNSEDNTPWEDSLQAASTGYSEQEQERHRSFLESRTAPATLSEVMLAQSATFPAEEHLIVEALVGNLDAWGYLRVSTAEVAEALKISDSEVESVLKKIQQLDPPGVAARDLKECLLLQLEREGKENSLASRLVRHYLPQLARHEYPAIAKQLHLDLSAILKAQKIIAALEPHPGRPYVAMEERSIIPDVIVIPDGKEFLVKLNEEGLSRVRLSDHYKDLLAAESQNKELRGYLKEKIHAGKIFIHHLEQRQVTLLSVTSEIVRQQHDFFHYGTYALHPLTMAQVAEALDVHPTTISRTVSGKTIETPHGFFPLKYFFTSGFAQEKGEEVSNEVIKSLLQRLIQEEDKQAPLSDQQIVTYFQKEGIPVARRTITNYRDQLGILPKKLRKIF